MTQPLGIAGTRRFQFHQFSLQQYRFEQLVDTLTRFGRDFDKHRVPAPIFRNHTLGYQFLLDAFNIGIGLVNFGNGHHQRHVTRPGMRRSPL